MASLEVFGMGRTDGRLVRIAQMAPNGGWSGFSTVGGYAKLFLYQMDENSSRLTDRAA